MLNKVTIIGNLGADPEIKQIPNGAVANFSVATTRSWKTKTGEKQTETEWFRVVMFGKVAGQYLKKGSLVYLEGRMKTRKWTKDGVDHYATEMIADQMKMLGGKPQQSKPQQSSDGYFDAGVDVPF